MLNVSAADRIALDGIGTTSVPSATSVAPGASVEVLSNYSGRWVPGFTVEEATERGCRLRRCSDHAVLPAWFGHHEVRVVHG